MVRKVQGLVDMIGLGLPEVEISEVTEEMEVEFCLLVVMLLVEETRLILTPLLQATTLTLPCLIGTKSQKVVKNTGIMQGRRSMING